MDCCSFWTKAKKGTKKEKEERKGFQDPIQGEDQVQDPIPVGFVARLYPKIKKGVVYIYCQGIQNFQQSSSTGVGWLYRFQAKVYVITSAHIVLIDYVSNPYTFITVEIAGVEGDPAKVRVFKARLLGVDATSDLAVLVPEISASAHKALTTLEFENSRLEAEGNPAFVLGNPLNADAQSVALGVIRDPAYAAPGIFIQEQVITDITIYQGNSGSPLINSSGKVIAITNFAFPSTSSPFFSSSSTSSFQQEPYSPGFGGGCSSFMMVPILHGIIQKTGTQVVPVRNSYPISSYLKALLGDVNWLLLTQSVAVQLYPQNWQNLNMGGLIVYQILSSYNVVQFPVCGKPLQTLDIIVAMQDPDGKWVRLGTFDSQYAAGVVLWQYDPTLSPIVECKVIHNPRQNTKMSRVKLKFNIQYSPHTETSPYTSGQLKLIGKLP